MFPSLLHTLSACGSVKPLQIASPVPDTAADASSVPPTLVPTLPPPTRLPPTPAPTPTPKVSTSFAVIGDFGFAGDPSFAVSQLVKSWGPALVLTTGDNNYPNGAAETIDQNVGQYYHEYIGNYQGTYGPGALTNAFFPSLGNHDWVTPNAAPYLDYFTLPGNERYYTFTQNPVQFFVLDSMPGEPDGVTQDSVQGQWLQRELAASTARWKVVVMHHSPFSSGYHGSNPWMQWPYREWGVNVVMGGHDHHYERLTVDGLTYLVNGLGGGVIYAVDTAGIAGSEVFYNADYGAIRVDADDTRMQVQFITRNQEVVDSFVLNT
jgi:hypothetical protein